MNEKKTLAVSILGKRYSIVTDEKSDIVDDAAALVNSLMRQTAPAPLPPAEMIKKATFVALQIAVDLLKERKKLETTYGKTATLNELLKETLTNN